MAGIKHNKWLDVEDSTASSDQGYDSELAEETKASRATKRRKLSDDEDTHASSESAQDRDEQDDRYNGGHASDASEDASTSNFILDDDKDLPRPAALEPSDPASRYDPSTTQSEAHRSRKHHKTTLSKDGPQTPAPNPRKLYPRNQKSPPESKTGVVYISRIPPFMKPSTLKSHLTPFGPVNRLFVTPEPPSSHRARVRAGGNKKRSFVDGWVEFIKKRHAKVCAEMLNTQIVGGRKGGWYHDDVWNVKYLRGFKWGHLTEQINNENAERAARLRQEIGQTTKENKLFVANVERGKMMENMRAKRERKGGREESADRGVVSVGLRDVKANGEDDGGRRGGLRQVQVGYRSSGRDNRTEHRPEVQRVLSKIF